MNIPEILKAINLKIVTSKLKLLTIEKHKYYSMKVRGKKFEELSKVEEYPATLLIDIAQQWIGTHLSLNIKSLIFLKSIF